MADYERIAAYYPNRYRDTAYPGITATLTALVRERPGARVLEVGCGTGHWLGLLQTLGVQAFGLDPSAAMLARGAPDGARVRGRAEAMPFRDAQFDLLICVNAFHHFRDRRAFFSEARRVLAPGGTIAIIGMDPHARVDRWYVYDYFDDTRALDLRRFPAREALRASLVAAGFRAPRTVEAEHLLSTAPAAEALAAGRLDKRATSQLSELDDAAYERGIARIREAISQTEGPHDLQLGVDVRLYVTRAER